MSEIIYIERSNFVLKGMGSDENGTELYFPRPMMYLKDPEPLVELREYLIELDKRQREKENNIDLPFRNMLGLVFIFGHKFQKLE
ncbi:MAG: hypothetical protein HC854_00250 [Flavobacterium sp.]|nr:hypothetical protein [Flavobacterium sp.]